MIGTINEPSTVMDVLEKHIFNADAILFGFPDETISLFIDIINRNAVSATTFVSVENLTVGYKTWTPFRFICTRKNQEIQTILNYFRKKPELLRQPVVPETTTLHHDRKINNQEAETVNPDDTTVDEMMLPGLSKNSQEQRTLGFSLADVFSNLSVKFKTLDREKTKIITINSPLDNTRTFTAVILPQEGDIDEEIKESEVIFVPASWGTNKVRRLRRELGNRAVLIIVIGGGFEFLLAGADKCVKRVSKKVIEETGVLAQRFQELWLRAETDPLTGCYARRFWDSWYDEQHRAKRPFAVALIDLDHFKSVNDTYGHQAGDAVLTSFGNFLRKSVRAGDIVARYGGEEFAIGQPYENAQSAKTLIDRLLQEWSNQQVMLPSGEGISCTFSAGTADSTHEDVLAEADRMLYEAKNTGRNQVQDAQSTAPKLERVTYRTSSITDTVITITSPWIIGCGVTTLTLEVAQHLLKKGYTVGLVDANTKRPGISRLLEIPDEIMWEYDWRTGGIEAGIVKDQLLIWALDPLRPGAAVAEDFHYLIGAASALSDYLIVDGGSEPDTGLVAGHILMVVAPGPDLPDIIRALNYFCPVADGSLVLTGECDVSGFGLPVAGLINHSGDWLDKLLSKKERR